MTCESPAPSPPPPTRDARSVHTETLCTRETRHRHRRPEAAGILVSKYSDRGNNTLILINSPHYYYKNTARENRFGFARGPFS